MLMQHLDVVSKNGQLLTENEIVIFGLLCVERQWEVFKRTLDNSKMDSYRTKIQNHLDILKCNIVNTKSKNIESISMLKENVEDLGGEENICECTTSLVRFSILQTTVDFLEAAEKCDTQYILEYSPYRNLDYIQIYEENRLGDIEEEFEKKNEQIKDLFTSEMKRQIEDMENLSLHPDEKQIEMIFDKRKGIDILNGLWL